MNTPAEFLYTAGDKIDYKINHLDSEEAFMNVVKTGNWWDHLKLNISGFFYRYGYLIFVSRIPKVLGMFLIGYVVGRSDFYKNIAQHKKLLTSIIIGGLLIGLPTNYMLARLMQQHMGDYFQLKTNGLYQTIAYAAGVVPLALAYAGLLVFAFKTATGKKILSLLAPVGKMAFSNYILQTLIGNFVFLGAGLGYMQQVGPVYFTLFGIIVFILQVIGSTIWLRYFNYGPVEWLWRSATYKKWQPFMKKKMHYS